MNLFSYSEARKETKTYLCYSKVMLVSLLFLSFDYVKVLPLLVKSHNSNPTIEPFRLGIDLQGGFSSPNGQITLANEQKNLIQTIISGNMDVIKNASNEATRAAIGNLNKRSNQRFCKKKYSTFCPEGWEENFQHNKPICIAPASYKGPCSTILTTPMTKEEKRNFEENCDINWPCMEYCERDYSKSCPVGWEETPDKLCRATTTYSDRCERLKDFTHFTPDMKKSWSESCNIVWPCLPQCQPDYNAPCPEEWTIKNTSQGFTCVSPKFYTGPCGPEEAIVNFDASLKETFAQRCKVNFPCKKKNNCQKDYHVLCPSQWIAIVEDASCEAPDLYTGPCDSRLFPLDFTEEKKSREVMCQVEWPCVEKCIPLYALPCPEHWEERNIKRVEGSQVPHGDCFPLPSYKGSCRGPKRLWDKTNEMKAAFAETCEVQWKCEHSITGLKSTGNYKKTTLLQHTGLNGPVNPHTGHISAQ